ncbi:MAG TPA: ribulose-phosphate 3-epimerase [Solirubrobacteraceae bacterium]
MAALSGELLVAPSILSADFARLGEQVAAVLDAGARVIHVDVMDGLFVPPITIGPLIVSAIADQVHGAGAMLDIHLMIERPERHAREFAKAGADSITLHAEATPHVNYAIADIHEAGCGAGVALTPSTPPGVLAELGDDLDLALCMSVNPGWGGQSFIASSPGKLRRMRELLGEDVVLEVDGGVDTGTVAGVVGAGATLLVAGSAIFSAPDPGAAYRALADAATAAAASPDS